MFAFNRIRRAVLLLFLLPLAHGIALAAADRRTIVFVVAADLNDSANGKWLRQIYGEAWRRLGYGFEMRPYPARRASMMSDSGQADGEISRVSSYGRAHPQMLRVDPAHFTITFAAYGAAPLKLEPGWPGLNDTAYRVEYRSGMARGEAELPRVVARARLSTASTTLLGLNKLRLGRTDVYIDIDSVVDPLLRQPEFAGAAIRKLAVMETVGMHTFLHRKNAGLVAGLSKVLVAMKREGYIEKCRLRSELAFY